MTKHAYLLTLVALQLTAAPTVTELVWGKITVSDTRTLYKDCKLSPSGSTNWDWNETGTRHVPGIQVADLEEFIDDVDIVILSMGMHGVLQVMHETEVYLKQKRKTYYIFLSDKAVELYNELVTQGKRVGALIYSTC